MNRDFTVVRIGTDSSGRSIYMTQWMLDVFNAIKKHPLVRPFAWKIVIVQGAFMLRNGGGARDSSGVHNYAGCIDIRTWNLTSSEITAWVHASRMLGFPFWRRDWLWAHGAMSPHAHGTLGSDSPLGSGASTSWWSYLHNGDGLAGTRGDYEWRPSPLVTFPPEELMQGGWLMADDAQEIKNKLDRLSKELNEFRTNTAKRDKELLAQVRASKERVVDVIGKVVDQLGAIETQVGDDATRKDVAKARDALLAALAADPTVDGRDNPAPQEDG